MQKITIDKVEYELNVKGAITLGLLKPIRKNTRYGTYWQRVSHDGVVRATYILAMVGVNVVSLINLDTGNRCSDGIKVNDSERITPQEFDSMVHESGEYTWREVPCTEVLIKYRA